MVHVHGALLVFSYMYKYTHAVLYIYVVLQHPCDTGTQTYCTKRNINSKASWQKEKGSCQQGRGYVHTSIGYFTMSTEQPLHL